MRSAIIIFHIYSRWRNSEIGEIFSVSGDAVGKKVARIERGAPKDRQLGVITKQFLSLFAARCRSTSEPADL